MVQNDAIRHFSARLGSEAIRIGQALGFSLEEILHIEPEVIARAGDFEAMRAVDDKRLSEAKTRSGGQRPSMGQDMVKGRRTEIEFLNGFVVRKGEVLGIPAPANAALISVVKRVERRELAPDPRHITELRLN
ncbi:ketopantoate reductase family protein [Acuticoccus sp.]|uniref:ketopantoate reductase family protein n=1 Tax=Acuticoccus sp. TaxID=1904378 RepID=UPI003B5229EC